MRATAMLLLCTPLLALGCDPDCSDPARLDGSYDVNANTVTDDWIVTGWDEGEAADEVSHLHGVFANGPSIWELKHVPADGAFRVTIDGQQFDATYKPTDANCNRFELSMSGAWTNPENSATHQFSWVGDMLWTGDQMGGTFTYEDQWGLDGRTGTVSIPSGEQSGALVGSGSSDTGS